LSKFYWRS